MQMYDSRPQRTSAAQQRPMPSSTGFPSPIMQRKAMLDNSPRTQALMQLKLSIAQNVTAHAQKIGVPDYDVAVEKGDQQFIEEFNHYHLLHVASQIPFLTDFIDHAGVKVSIAQGFHVNTSTDPSYKKELRLHQTLKVIGKGGKKGPSWHLIWQVENEKLIYEKYTQENKIDAQTFLKANKGFVMPGDDPLDYDPAKYAGYVYVAPPDAILDTPEPDDSDKQERRKERARGKLWQAWLSLENAPHHTSGWHRILDRRGLNNERAIHGYVMKNLETPAALFKLWRHLNRKCRSGQVVDKRMLRIYTKYRRITAALVVAHAVGVYE